MSKQDRQGVRTATDLERKYDFSLLTDKNIGKFSSRISKNEQDLMEHIESSSKKLEEINEQLEAIGIVNENTQEIIQANAQEIENVKQSVSDNANEIEDLKPSVATAYEHSQQTSGNPHNVSKSDVGLGNVDNTSDADKPVSTAQKQAIDAVSSNLTSHEENKSNPHSVTKAQVGLGNVNNTADISKPVSTAQQTAIDKAYANANAYTDEKIAGLINGAPTTLDTLGEIAKAMADNADVVEALNASIGSKASQAELDSHVGNSTIHTTATEKSNWNKAYEHSQATHTIAQGGTGATTSKGAEYNILGKIEETTGEVEDTTQTVFKYSSPSATKGVLVYKQASLLWDYIKSKISSVLGLTATSYGGTANKATTLEGLTSTVAELNYCDGVTSNIQAQLDEKLSYKGGTNLKAGDDLNNFKTPGNYISGSSTVTAGLINPPVTGSGFKLIVIDGYISGRVTQFVTTNRNSLWFRQYNGTSWGEWAEFFTTSNVPTLSELGITATKTELNYCDGVTSNIQTQLNNKVAKTTEYYGDINALVTSGFYRVGTNTNLPTGFEYGQIIVSRGSDTATQICCSYSTGKIITRGCNSPDSSPKWSAWVEYATMDDIGEVGGGGFDISYANESITLLPSGSTLPTWNLLTSTSGTTGTITLPTKYSELHILIGISNYMYTFNILADYLTTTAQSFRNGYALSTTVYGDVYIALTKTQITAWTVRKENVVQTATIKVYYR